MHREAQLGYAERGWSAPVNLPVPPRGSRGQAAPPGGPFMAIFRWLTRRTIRDYRKSGADGVSKRMGFLGKERFPVRVEQLQTATGWFRR